MLVQEGLLFHAPVGQRKGRWCVGVVEDLRSPKLGVGPLRSMTKFSRSTSVYPPIGMTMWRTSPLAVDSRATTSYSTTTWPRRVVLVSSGGAVVLVTVVSSGVVVRRVEPVDSVVSPLSHATRRIVVARASAVILGRVIAGSTSPMTGSVPCQCLECVLET
jgi:hypothetical protein